MYLPTVFKQEETAFKFKLYTYSKLPDGTISDVYLEWLTLTNVYKGLRRR